MQQSIAIFIMTIGIFLLILSIVLYIKRTKDSSVLFKFWASKADLNKSELNLNRLGLIIFILGFLVRLF